MVSRQNPLKIMAPHMCSKGIYCCVPVYRTVCILKHKQDWRCGSQVLLIGCRAHANSLPRSGSSERHVPPVPIRAPERSSRLAGQKGFCTLDSKELQPVMTSCTQIVWRLLGFYLPRIALMAPRTFLVNTYLGWPYSPTSNNINWAQDVASVMLRQLG